MLRSVLVKDYMMADPLAFTPETEVLNAIHLLLEHRLSGAPVVDADGRVVGFLSEKDCLKVALNASYYEERGGLVGQYMSRDVLTVEANSALTAAIDLFIQHPYRCFPVLDEDRLVGRLSRRDALKALERLW